MALVSRSRSVRSAGTGKSRVELPGVVLGERLLRHPLDRDLLPRGARTPGPGRGGDRRSGVGQGGPGRGGRRRHTDRGRPRLGGGCSGGRRRGGRAPGCGESDPGGAPGAPVRLRVPSRRLHGLLGLHGSGPVPRCGILRLRRCRVVVDVDAEVPGQARQPGRVPLSDRTELPRAEAPVELAEDEGAHLSRLLDGEGEQGFARAVREGDPQIVEFAEPGAPVAAGGDHQAVDRLRNRVEVEADAVLVTVGGGRLAQQLHASVARDRGVVEAEVGVVPHLAVLVEQQHGDVRVALPRRAAPAETHDDRPDVLAQRGQSDVRAFDHGAHMAPQMHCRSGTHPAARRVAGAFRPDRAGAGSGPGAVVPRTAEGEVTRGVTDRRRRRGVRCRDTRPQHDPGETPGVVRHTLPYPAHCSPRGEVDVTTT